MVALRTGKPVEPTVLGVFNPVINETVWVSLTATPIFHPGEASPSQAYAFFQDITAERKAQQDYQLLFREMLDGFALHEIITDASGKPVDYRFIAVNPAFEAMTGLKSANIIGKTVLEVFPDTEPYWIETYGKVALTGDPVRFENFSISTGKYFSVSAYQPKPRQFACTFSDVSDRIIAEKTSTVNLSRLQGLLDNNPGPIMMFDLAGKIVDASACFLDMVLMTKAEIRGKLITQVLPPRIAERIKNTIASERYQYQTIESIDVFELKGERRFFECRLFPIPTGDPDEKLFCYIGIDVTKRLIAEQSLKESQEKYSSYIQNAPDGIIILDRNGNFIEVNDSSTTISGYSRAEMMGMNIDDVLAKSTYEDSMNLFKETVTNGAARGEVQYILKNGNIRWGKIGSVKLSEDRFLIFFSDITDKKTAEENLVYASTHDYLTGLFNRRFFDTEETRLNVPEQLPLSFIIGDINGLKLINDSFGRKAGDMIITETAKIIQGFCRPDDVPAKTGGDEFSILLPKTSYKTAVSLIHQIQTACRENLLDIGTDKYQISISFGAGTKTKTDESMLDVYKQAEDNMNQHKLLEKRSSYSAIISSIQATMLEKSNETEAHSERLVQLAKAMGQRMGLSQTDLDHLELLATLHDIGKIGISEQVLNKPGKLNASEWEEMRRHPEIGYRIALSTSNLAPIAEYILCHHERWDGNGYPQNLSGTDIPLLSRILAVADAYDAMTQDRVYRKAMSHEAAMEEMNRNAGTQFDPYVVKVFHDVMG